MSNDTSIEPLWRLLFKTVESIRNYQCRTVQAGPRPELSFSQVRVLGCVIMNPEGRLRLHEIASELGITPGAVSQLVDHLVRDGLLERVSDPDDRRAVIITLSEFGSRLHRELDNSFDALFTRLFAGVSVADRAAFSRVLTSINTKLKEEL